MLKSFFTGLIALLLACGVWEVITRSLIYERPALIVVPGLGHMRPGGGETQSNEGWARSWFDKDGYRGGQPKIKPKTVILGIGDSYVEAMEVADNKTFCSRLQALLKANGREVWVANPSIAGGSPARYVYVANWYESHLHPDRVIVALNWGDFLDDLLNPTQEFHLQRDGAGYRLVSLSKLPSDSKLGKVPVSLAKLVAQRLRPAPNEAAKGNGSAKIDYLGLVKWTVANLKTAYGNPILVYIPRIDYFDLSVPPQEVEGELAVECAKEGLTFINMRADYIKRFEETHELSHGFPNSLPGEGHINELGHELIAEELAKAIESGK